MPNTQAIADAIAPVVTSLSDAAKAVVTITRTGPAWYIVNRQADDEVEVMIYDAIGAWGISASQFVRDLKDITAKRIRLRLNTPGGEVFDATAIYNALLEHPAEIVVHVDGVAASAGSVIAMAGNEVRMADNAYMMIHNGHGGAYGEAEDMRRYADLLDKVNDNIAGIYHQKAGKGKKHWRDLMSAETWFTAAEAKAEGLADAVDKPAKADPAKASFDFKIYNTAKIPEPVRRLWGITPPAPPQNGGPLTVADFAEFAQAHVNEIQSTTPEAPPRGETPPTDTKETPPMADNATIAAPAQTPAAGPSGIQQGNEIQQLNQQAVQGYIERGRKMGYAEGIAAEQTRMKTLQAAVPSRPDLVVQAFIANQEASTMAMIANAEAAAEARASQTANELRVQNARLEALVATGGHPGVAFYPGEPAGGTPSIPTGLEPEQQAKLEWDSDAMLRAKHGSNEKQYLLYRVNQLKGNVRVLKTA